MLDVHVHQQPRIGVGQALNTPAPRLEYCVSQAHKLQVSHREIAHAARNLAIQQHALVGAGVEGWRARELWREVQNIPKPDARAAQVTADFELRHVVGNRAQAGKPDAQAPPDAGVRRHQIEAVEPDLHRVVHHRRPPRIHPKAALLAPGQVLDHCRGAVFGEEKIARIQHQVRKVQVVVIERRNAGALPGPVEVVELHIDPADVRFGQRHAPAQRLAGRGGAAGGAGLVGRCV